MRQQRLSLILVAAMLATDESNDKVNLTAKNVCRTSIAGAELAKCIERLANIGAWHATELQNAVMQIEQRIRVSSSLYHRHGVFYLRTLDFDPGHDLDHLLDELFDLLDPLLGETIQLTSDVRTRGRDISEEVVKIQQRFENTFFPLLQQVKTKFPTIANFDAAAYPEANPDTLLEDMCVEAASVIKKHDARWVAVYKKLHDWGVGAVVEVSPLADEVFKRYGDIEKQTRLRFAYRLLHILQSVGEHMSLRSDFPDY